MTFGNAAWGFRETPLEQQLKITKDMELELLELGIANAPNDLQIGGDTSAVKELYEKYGIKLLCAATGNDFSNGNKDDVEKIKKVVDMCCEMRVKYLRIFAGFSHVEDVTGKRWETMIDALNEVYGYAIPKNVIPVVETHGGVDAYPDGVVHFYSTSSKPDALVKMIDRVPDIKINYDPANLYAVGIKNPEDVYEMIKDKVCYIHLKDFVKTKSGRLLPASCGESDMDWKKVLEPIKDFDGPVLFEYENTEDTADGCRRCYEFIKQKLKEI